MAINMGEAAPIARISAQSLVDQFHLRFPIGWDPDGATLKRWKPFVAPTLYVIDEEGAVVHMLLGESESDAALAKQLEPWLPTE
ncbi:hypothetical protein MAIT1_04243 [Magnetofaba australis IT-1]|uniref:Alkyl hydroperoxide reductase subunit C/ Thiol specific antioxidant domain-containing protein n=2 Tax=Magnetofaba TaxID=1472292 RepID=A0A1Y2K521_9PROT|nr:hypothetical protein MAIT1_04243 [Magnetofaba australis IT-1]